jgi:tryptophan synthase alpha chain
MNDIGGIFKRLRAKNKCALIPYLMAYYPSKRVFPDVLLAAQDAGADLIEVGIPFSDPIADGPAIQRAGQTALAEGATAGRVFETLSRMNGKLAVPLVIMTYSNLLIRRGVGAFFADARRAGALGAVIPDLGLEESPPFRDAARKHGVDLIQFVAPTTPKDRIGKIAREADGFVYLVSVTGVTGARPGENFDLRSCVEAIRAAGNLPVCVGFGIATPTQAANVAKIADGVIIGSAIVGVASNCSPGRASVRVGRFLNRIRKAMDSDGGTTCG